MKKNDIQIYLRNNQPVRKNPLKNFLTFLFVLLLIFVNYYVFFTGSEKGARPTINDRIKMPQLSGNPAKNKKIESLPVINKNGEALKIVKGEVKKGEAPFFTLNRLGVSENDATSSLKSLSKFIDLTRIKAGQIFEIVMDADGSLLSLKYPISDLSYFEVFKNKEGFDIGKKDVPVDVNVEKVGCVIMSSLYESMKNCGEDPNLATMVADILSWDIDFFKDVRKGDRIKILVEKLSVNGKFLKYGSIHAIEYIGKFGHYFAFLYKDGDEKDEYYNNEGFSTKKKFLKAPLRYTKISSQFSQKRLHPVFHKYRKHLAIDYAAPIGTPVWGVGDGKVVFKGRKGGNGNLVVLDHGDGVKTYYAHLSKFSKNLNVGDIVGQKDVIGYVGATGIATGPHLHFAVSYDGKFIHPKQIRNISVKSIEPSLIEKFMNEVKKYINEIRNIPIKGFSRESV